MLWCHHYSVLLRITYISPAMPGRGFADPADEGQKPGTAVQALHFLSFGTAHFHVHVYMYVCMYTCIYIMDESINYTERVCVVLVVVSSVAKFASQ